MASRKRDDLRWEQSQAALAAAAFRPLTQSRLQIATTSEETYTITDKACKRVVIHHSEAGGADIHFELNATADATKITVAEASYFVVEVDVGDVVHLFNSGGSTVDVYCMEIM